MFKAIHNYIENHKGARRITLFAILSMIIAVSIKVFWFSPALSMTTVTAYGTLVGLLTVAIGFYNHNRGREDASSNPSNERFRD